MGVVWVDQFVCLFVCFASQKYLDFCIALDLDLGSFDAGSTLRRHNFLQCSRGTTLF